MWNFTLREENEGKARQQQRDRERTKKNKRTENHFVRELDNDSVVLQLGECEILLVYPIKTQLKTCSEIVSKGQTRENWKINCNFLELLLFNSLFYGIFIDTWFLPFLMETSSISPLPEGLNARGLTILGILVASWSPATLPLSTTSNQILKAPGIF